MLLTSDGLGAPIALPLPVQHARTGGAVAARMPWPRRTMHHVMARRPRGPRPDL